MSIFTVQPKPLKETSPLRVPPSKSHSQRALLFASKGQGISLIENLLDSPDVRAMQRAIEAFGATCKGHLGRLEVLGNLATPTCEIDAENSGQILRFIAAFAALLPSRIKVTGDASIRTRRPIAPLLSALRQLGANVESINRDGHAPIAICGPIRSGTCRLDGQDSQPVSALLMATAFLDGPSEIFVDGPKETPWIDLTLHWLSKMGAQVANTDYRHYYVKGGLRYSGLQYTVPGDYSSACYPLAASLITGSPLNLAGLCPSDVQGDRIVIELAKQMGAKITWKEDLLSIEPGELNGMDIDANLCIDALPVLAALGCYAKGSTRIYNGAIARKKESDRIHAITQELQKMGAKIEEKEDGLIIHYSPLRGGAVSSHQDHRIALALTVAAMGADGPTTIEGAEWTYKSYPSFAQDMNGAGAHIELDLMRI